MHPIVAIVGRPNVGKSRLFNRLVGRPSAIVAEVPGVTRDRHYALAEWAGREFIAVDTGGLSFDEPEGIEGAVSRQSLVAMEEADVTVLIFDGQCEPASTDKDVVEKIRKLTKNAVFAVNKIDEELHEGALNAYHEMGVSPLVPVSAEHGRNVDALLEEVVKFFPDPAPISKCDGNDMVVAVVGRPNVGKSTLINRLAGQERVVVHELPGTTRDSIDVEIEFDGRRYVFVDTAGIKKHIGLAEKLERHTAMRSIRSIDRAGVVLLLIDAAEGVTRQDIHLAGFVLEDGKGLIILANKFDIAKAKWEDFEDDLRSKLGQGAFAIALPVSAMTGLNCLKIFQSVRRVNRALSMKVPTSRLNRAMEKAKELHHMPVHHGREVKIYYATQVGTHPPTFALFSNLPSAVPYSYRRYIINFLQKELGLEDCPVRIVCRKK